MGVLNHEITQKLEVQLQYALRSDSGNYEGHIDWGGLKELWDVCQNQAKQGKSENLVLVYARKLRDNKQNKTLYRKIADLAGPNIKPLFPGLFPENDAEEETQAENVPTSIEEKKKKLVSVSAMSQDYQLYSDTHPSLYYFLINNSLLVMKMLIIQ